MNEARLPQADSVFATAVVLAKREVFDALEACASAERALLRCGRATEAAAVASLFEMLEDRVTLDSLPPTPMPSDPAAGPSDPAAAG